MSSFHRKIILIEIIKKRVIVSKKIRQQSDYKLVSEHQFIITQILMIKLLKYVRSNDVTLKIRIRIHIFLVRVTDNIREY